MVRKLIFSFFVYLQVKTSTREQLDDKDINDEEIDERRANYIGGKLLTSASLDMIAEDDTHNGSYQNIENSSFKTNILTTETLVKVTGVKNSFHKDVSNFLTKSYLFNF